MLTTFLVKGCIRTGHLAFIKDVFQTRECMTRSKEWYRALFNPHLETMQPVVQVNEVSYGKANWHSRYDQSNSGQSHPVQSGNNFRDTNRHQRGSFKKILGKQHYKHSPRKLSCYYCEGEHLVKDCIKLAKEKSRDKQKDIDVARCYKNKLQDTMAWGVILLSMRHHLPGHQQWTTPWNKWNSYWGTCN